MISVEEALGRILAEITPLNTIQVPLADALGMVLAQDIVAQEDIPPFANSAMDGFALLSKDTRPQEGKIPHLRVTGGIAAGYLADHSLEPGTAMRITTGAPIPPGADAVIQVELTRANGPESDWVEILQEIPPGCNIRAAGGDMQRGQTILRRGIEIRAWQIGILAMLGWSTVPVVRRARVAIVGTGDEIVGIDQPLKPGKIRDSNSYLLEGAIRTIGAEVYRLGIARDTIESLHEKLEEAKRYDLIVTSGGVSVGDFDLVKDIMVEEGRINFWRINMRPGKPMAFGQVGGIPLLGLPGNPVSSAVAFELFGRPLIRKLQGHSRLRKPQVEVVIVDGMPKRTMRPHYMRAHVVWQYDHFVAHTTGNQDSHIMTSLLNANALVIVPESDAKIHSIDSVKAIMLDWPEE